MKILDFIRHKQRKNEEYKLAYERRKLIDYYETINQGQVSIPSFMLADMALKRKYGG